MILKRGSVLLAHVMVLVWVLADLADKGGMLFGDQVSSHFDQPFGSCLGFTILMLLTPTPRLPKSPISVKLVALTAVILAIGGVVPLIAFARLSSSSPVLAGFALDLLFGALVLSMMWRLPKHDLELVVARDRSEQGTITGSASSSIS